MSQVDFYSMLSGLGDTIQSARKERQQQQILQARKGAFSDFTALDPGSPDYGRQALGVAQKLGAVGDQEGALKFLTLAQSASEKAHTRQREGIMDARDARDYELRARAAARAEDPTPSGFQKAPTGGLQPIPGGPADPAYKRNVGDRQNAPSGYRWTDPENPNAGMVAIPGGPAEKVDAEVAARLGLAKSFLGELPDIKRKIAAGGLSGPVDTASAMAGIGSAGELRRKMDSGAEALLRMLTGAGMNKEEAAEYTRRYKFSPKTDIWGPETALSKMAQLERELNSVGETVGKGRGGWSLQDGNLVPNKQAEPSKTKAAPAMAAPAGAVAELKKDPRLAAQFDAKYGQGAAKAALGGRDDE